MSRPLVCCELRQCEHTCFTFVEFLPLFMNVRHIIRWGLAISHSSYDIRATHLGPPLFYSTSWPRLCSIEGLFSRVWAFFLTSGRMVKTSVFDLLTSGRRFLLVPFDLQSWLLCFLVISFRVPTWFHGGNNCIFRGFREVSPVSVVRVSSTPPPVMYGGLISPLLLRTVPRLSRESAKGRI